jgi:ferritin-like metal-binding protein YciE
MEEILLTLLREMYFSEARQSQAYASWTKSVSAELMAELAQHADDTSEQLTHLEEIFAHLREDPRKKKCVAVESLIAETTTQLHACKKPEKIDAFVMVALVKIGHYNAGVYKTMILYANLLKQDKIADLLRMLLDEELGYMSDWSDIISSDMARKST